MSAQHVQNMRELRVEDALLYLDQVKMEFQHVQRKPQIYNEFLEIMKNFKSQTIDTPGVIQKVSQLFRGYNKLILGFNTFLPEGHKIKLEDIERNEHEMAAREQREAEQRRQEMLAQQQARSTTPVPQLPTMGEAKPPMSMPMAADVKAPPPGAMPPAFQHQEFDHAISYVTNIKQRFQREPETYKAFLDILHAYQRDQLLPKEMQKGIHDVLDQVSALFADHPDLLKEFTYFLPDAVQDQAKERLERAAR